MAISAALTVIVTAVLTGSTIALWLATRRLWRGAEAQARDILRSVVAAEKAADAVLEANMLSRQALITDQRPWLIPDTHLTSGLKWDMDEGRIGFRFEIRNTGKTPARYAAIDALLHCETDAPLEDVYAKLSERMRQRPLGDGYTIFPGVPFTQEIDFGISIEGLRADFAKTGYAEHGEALMISPVLVGIIDYLDTFTDTHHQTGFAFEIRRQLTAANTLAIGPDHGDLSMDEISFFVALNGFIAD